MLSFTNLISLQNGPEDVYKYIKKVFDNDEEAKELNFDANTIEFERYLGGDVFVVESPEDLQLIDTAEESEDDSTKWANITEKAGVFDGCEYIADGKYVAIFLGTNNSGGNSYFVPREIADTCPNIEESIKQTKIAWGVDEDNE